MVLVGAFILPHGSMVLDIEKENLPEGAIELNKEMLKVGEIVKKLNPKLCLLITPHGICLNNDFGLYWNETASGSAEWEGEYTEYQIQVPLNRKTTEALFKFLKRGEIPVSTIVSYTPSAPIPLRWGEAVPLYFLQEIDMDHIIMSIPTRRYNQAPEMIPELLNVGTLLKEFIENLKERTVVIISADLAHTHSHDGPYNFSDTAEEFDSLIEQYIQTQDEKLLLTDASKLLNHALACGFAGIVISHNLLRNSNLQAEILIRNHPSYYGMMVVKYT